MQKTLVCFLLISSMIGLSQNDSPVIFDVTATCETTPVESPDDGADDPSIWEPANNQSFFYVTIPVRRKKKRINVHIIDVAKTKTI